MLDSSQAQSRSRQFDDGADFELDGIMKAMLKLPNWIQFFNF